MVSQESFQKAAGPAGASPLIALAGYDPGVIMGWMESEWFKMWLELARQH
jgi:hypothetical protein